jgi:hypothetical protein
MKKLIYALLIAGISTATMAQQKDEGEKNEKKVTPPSQVASAFKKDFPAVKKAGWEMEDGNYEAEFTTNGGEQSALYDDTGHRLEVETEIKVEELPQTVRDYIKEKYPASKINEASKIVNNKGVTTYEAEVGKGKEKTDLIFDSNGKFIKVEKD